MTRYIQSIHTLVAMIALMTVNMTNAQTELTPGQTQIQKLRSMIGEWELTDENGKVSMMTIRWINNKSFIELIHGDYREITRWDLVEKRFVTQAFGEVGGHSKHVWTEKEPGTWDLVADPAYYVASGKPVPWNATLTFVDKDRMTFKGKFGKGEMDNTARRKKPLPEPENAKKWTEFLMGDWHREIETTKDGETTHTNEDWTCKLSGNATASYGVTGDGYVTMMAWDADLGGMLEQGRSPSAAWEILFVITDTTITRGKITGRLADGRTGEGTTVVTRTGDDSYTAESTLKLIDGSTLRVLDKNMRK